MPFFAKIDKSSKKRSLKGQKISKASQNVKLNSRAVARARLEKQLAKEDVDSSSDEEQMQQVKRWKEDEDKLEDTETAQEKKERLAKQILQELAEQRAEREAESKVDSSVPVQQRLRDEVLEASGKLFRRVAKDYTKADQCSSIDVLQCKKFQRKTITCVAVSLTDSSIFSSSWDGSIVKYSNTGQKLGVIKSKYQDPKAEGPRHSTEILALALSSNGKYIVSGDKAGVIHVWDAATLTHVDALRKHRGAVTGLAFQRNTLSLFSCGLDRLVMEWSLDNMAYVDNLGGHSSGVLGIDALYRQSCITCGGSDETVMIYAIPEDKQFQFQAKQVSIDGVRLLNANTFITYGQDGSLCLWSTNRKRPVQQLKVAHGYHDADLRNPHWITALAALVNTDLVASGSSDGFIRLWRVDNAQGTKLHAISRILIPPGTVNSLEFSSDGTMLVAALSRTHKHGRWFLENKAKNCVLLIKFPDIKFTKPTPLSSTLKAAPDSLLPTGANGAISDDEEDLSEEDEEEELSGDSEVSEEEANGDGKDEDVGATSEDVIDDEETEYNTSDCSDEENGQVMGMEEDSEDDSVEEQSGSDEDG